MAWLSYIFRAAMPKRNIWALLFEVLPIWLLALQSAVAISASGDVDGRSREPLFGGLRMGKKAISGANERIHAFLGRWSISERRNMDEFMEGEPRKRHSPNFFSVAAVLGFVC